MAPRTRERIISGARGLLAQGEMPTVERVAAAAGVSKTTFYRAFDSREELLEALEVQPEPGTRERVLETAQSMVGAGGMAALVMDELAVQAGVSRATLYRLFPGKPALFTSILRAYSPLEPVSQLAISMGGEPPERVIPEIARTVFRTVYAPGEPRIGLLRAIFLELSSLSPDAEEAARDLLATTLGSVGAYVMAQMTAGRLRTMHPLLALQSLIGPIFFHLLTRSLAERVLGLEMDGEQAVVVLAESWLRAMKPDPEEDADG
ncbi:MAG TPA: TetR/AcrR family transcriptional regulator [Candidatus Dormibacteraeota bacterium]|nr:TetR/AcrR family transcriptional regulator [Candidatus Dormibacteraeota bacterium]